MTQLFIAGVEAVLPQSFSVAVKRENPFFTKSGEYTYDCTLRLDNPVNLSLWGFLNRLNKADEVQTSRTAVLMADGRVYCRGTEVVTKWTEQTVSIQIVSGEAELNFFIGQDRKIEDLWLGDIGTTLDELEGRYDDYMFDTLPTLHKTYGESDYCLPTINAGGTVLNRMFKGYASESGQAEPYYRFTDATPQPYLCALLRRLMQALHYNEDREWLNPLEDTPFRNLFLVNTVRTTEYAKMLPGWTVKDFLSEVERLTGCVFITDNSDPLHPTVDVVLKTSFYQDASELPLSNVVDAYEAEVADDDTREAEFTASDVSYELPDGQLQKLMRLPDDYLSTATIIEHATLADMQADAAQNPNALHRVAGRDRLYILSTRQWYSVDTACLVEVNQFSNLDRENNTSTLELKITPAPMDVLSGCKGEVITLGAVAADNEDEEVEDERPIEQQIQEYSKKDAQAGDLYCAFFNGFSLDNYRPLAYTDAYHATVQSQLFAPFATQTIAILPEGSLRLQDLDADYYQGGYQIDTAHPVTFSTFDPNRIDVRQVYVIGNRRYVVRDCEETVTAEGRQKLWKLTCFPIDISDTAMYHRWVLTRGVWDDGGAWLDDGRWNDSPT